MQRQLLSTSSLGLTLGLSLVALLSSAPLNAQAQDPQAPPAGFEILSELDQEVAYSDGAKTLIDIRYPDAAPGPDGWPVVLVVHGLGGDRKEDLAFGKAWASQGFLSAIYDVRGQGAFPTLSSAAVGTEMIGKSERLDMVEIVNFIRQRYADISVPLADLDRLGIEGLSQGGAHAWAAAAWSGKDLPANERGLTRFPVFKAVCPNLFPPYSSEVSFPQGASVQNSFLGALFNNNGVVWQPEFGSRLRNAILNQDFAKAARIIDDDPFRRDLEMLRTSDVPVFAQLGWNDTWASAEGVLKAMEVMPEGTPRRAFLEPTMGHGLKMNTNQVEQQISNLENWMSHYLKGDENGIDRGAEFVTGVVAASKELYANPDGMVWNRHHDIWPPTRTDTQRFFLHSGNTLTVEGPLDRESKERVKQVVAGGYDMRAYIEESRLSVQETLQRIPLSSVVYDSPVLEQDVEIAGTPRVRLEVTPDSKEYQVHVALYQVSVSGKERFIASGMALVQNANRLGLGSDTEEVTLDIPMIPTDALILEGERIRLKVENLTLRSFGQQENLWVAPYFNSYSFEIEHSILRPSWFDLPVRQTVQPALSTSVVSFDILNPENITYTIEAPPSLGGRPYQVYFSASGTENQQQMSGSDPLRLVEDELTRNFLAIQSPLLVGMTGFLSEDGKAEASLLLRYITLPPSLRGLRLSTAVVVEGQFGPIATNPVDMYIK